MSSRPVKYTSLLKTSTVGLGLGTQVKPFLRVVSAMFFIAFLSIFYFFSDVTTNGYIELMKKTGVDSEFNFEGPVTYFSDDQNVSHTPKDGYLVWNPSCKIPDIDPYHESIRRLLKTVPPVECSSLRVLTKIKGDNLMIVPGAVKYYTPKKYLKCCYQQIFRNDSQHVKNELKPDNLYEVTPCRKFENSVKLTDEEQFILVKCSTNKTAKNKDKEVYTNMHARVTLTQKLKDKIKQSENENKDRLSVLLVGIDSISRMNLLRTMPQTVSFLRDQGWSELRGYNKMDDNTFPNLMAILTGQSQKQIRTGGGCLPSNRHNVDNCPFIWKDFAKEGYLTAYGEDQPFIGTFNYQKTGFYEMPTDYYLRPFLLAAGKYLKVKKKDGLNICLGPTATSDHILQYTLDMATTLKNTLYFALFWMNSFSHNNVNTPSMMDLRMLKFFKDLTESGALNNTMVVFLSDHGMRFGKIRQTFVGWLEERLPFFHLWMPEWYREKYSQKFSNLVVNADRLTSPYDLHLTLKDVLHNNHSNGTSACPKCCSLFDEVPWNRSCADVGVTEHWCTCSEYRTLSTEGQSVRAMVKYALDEVNKIVLSTVNLTINHSKCAKLSVNKILSVRSKLFERKLGYDEYIVLFETLPGEALFEATVRHDYNFKLLDTISRINSYGSQSKCISDAYLQKYCFCVKS